MRHLEFSKFRVFVTSPLSPCYSASLYKTSLKSDNRLLSYGRKNGAVRRLEFKKIKFGYVTVFEF